MQNIVVYNLTAEICFSESHCEILKKVDKLDYSDEKNGVFVSLQQAIWSVFSNADNLNRFFLIYKLLLDRIPYIV